MVMNNTRNVIQAVNVDSISFSEKIGGKMTITCEETKLAIKRAAEVIKGEGLVAFPTETVYGLGACSTSSKAVLDIFKTKGRPQDNPLIVHISSIEMLKKFILIKSKSKQQQEEEEEKLSSSNLNDELKIPLIYKVLIDSFWPGPLTLLMPISTEDTCPISKLVTCGLSTVAVRIPEHRIARALISEAGVPIAAPSANISGRPSPTTAQHVHNDFKDKIPIILDGGPCLVGVESTVVDGLNPDGHLRILRLGGLSVELIQDCLINAGFPKIIHHDQLPLILENNHHHHQQEDFKPTTPGMKYKHYSPNAKVLLLDPIILSSSYTNLEKNQYIFPNVNELLCQLEKQMNPSSNSNQDTNNNNNNDRGGREFKVGLMMIEGSPLSKNFQNYNNENNNNNNSRKIIKIYNSNLGKKQELIKSAQKLFSSLRYLDEEIKVDLILVESLPKIGLGKTIMERLFKSTAFSTPLNVFIDP